MKSRFKVLGHPLHPILIVFPLAFYPVAAIAEVIYLLLLAFGWKPTDMLLNFDVGFFWRAAFALQFVGLLGTLAAALPGFVDWLNIPNEAPAKDKATFHLTTGLLIAGITVLSILLLDWGAPPAELLTHFTDHLGLIVGVGLSIFNGLILVTYQGWLGGELVYRHGIGVERTDDIDPISITPGGGPAQENA